MLVRFDGTSSKRFDLNYHELQVIARARLEFIGLGFKLTLLPNLSRYQGWGGTSAKRLSKNSELRCKIMTEQPRGWAQTIRRLLYERFACGH